MSAKTAKVLPFSGVANGAMPEWQRQLKLPSISDEQHLQRALQSGLPHSYLAARGGMLSYGGLRGLGLMNAQQLHLKVFKIQGHMGTKEDLENAFEEESSSTLQTRSSVSYSAALQAIQPQPKDRFDY